MRRVQAQDGMHISEAYPKTRSEVHQEIPANNPTETSFGKTSSDYEIITASRNWYKYTVDDGTVRPDDATAGCDVCPDIGGLHDPNVSGVASFGRRCANDQT